MADPAKSKINSFFKNITAIGWVIGGIFTLCGFYFVYTAAKYYSSFLSGVIPGALGLPWSIISSGLFDLLVPAGGSETKLQYSYVLLIQSILLAVPIIINGILIARLASYIFKKKSV